MTSKLTREQLHERARENVKTLKMASRQTAFESAREEILADLQLAELALAAMDSEPVAIIDQANLDYLRSGADADVWPPEREEMGDVLLYRHPQPAPVVPEEKPIPNTLSMYAVDAVAAIAEVKGWNACRAAMLQAGTITNEGTKQAWTGIPDIDNAINMLDRIDTLESCDDDRVEAVKTVLRRLAGNSPVIPDGYVMVPVKPTREILDEFDSIIDYGAEDSVDAWRRLLAAATKEVKGE
ncbi:hypothetical protein [Klebsiella pneumoniae]|uniref:hypothetical protein n=1 Tax=Klebsiella pneumoniae TaxID=573 RepID=UPI0034E094C3